MRLHAALPFAVFLPLAAPTPGVETRDDLPEGSALMDRFQAAVGDRARIDGFANVVYHGTATWEGLDGSGTVTETYAGLDKGRTVTEFEHFGTVDIGTDGAFVWEKTPLGTTIRLGWDAAQYVREFGLFQHLPWRKLYRGASTSAVEEVEGRRCWVVQLFPREVVKPEGEEAERIPPPDVLYLDVETTLPRRLRARAVGVFDEPVTRVLDFGDWRATDGVKYPVSVVLEVSGFRLAIEYSAIEHDVELPEGFFEPDADVLEALEKERSGERERKDDEMVIEELEVRHLASIRVTCAHADMQRTLSVLLPEAFEHVTSAGVGMAGPPLVRYHQWGDPVDLEAAIPLVAPIEAKGRMKPETLPAGSAIVAWHVGPYEKLGETHERIQAFMKEKGYEQRSALWEEYWTDPGMEPDSSKWRTRIVTPIHPVK